MERRVAAAGSGFIFEEDQLVRNSPWGWLALAGAGLIVAVFGYALYQQLVLGRPWGDRPMSDAALIALALPMFALAGFLAVLGLAGRLTVRVRPAELQIRYFPLVNKTIPWADIAACTARSYRPLLEYGGWGVRWGGRKRGWAYSVSGNRGVQLELASGKRILIGSKRAEELEAAFIEAGGPTPPPSTTR